MEISADEHITPALVEAEEQDEDDEDDDDQEGDGDDAERKVEARASADSGPVPVSVPTESGDRPERQCNSRIVPAYVDSDVADTNVRPQHLQHDAQDYELALDAAIKVADASAVQKHCRGAWKDEWVVALIHARGAMDEDLSKSQRPGVDMWAKVALQIAAAHMDFDKNSESCRNKWQRVLKVFKDCQSHNSIRGNEKQMTCKFYDLVDHYTHYSSNGHATPMDELEVGSPQVPHVEFAPVESVHMLPYAHVTPLEFVQALPLVPTHVSPAGDPLLRHSVCSQTSVDYSTHRIKSGVKRVHRDQEIEQSLSQMVETWKESLQVMKESEAKRIEILQTLSATMVGLLDVLRK